jgi:hypothetical protein
MAIRLGRLTSQLLMPLVFSAHAGSLLALTGTPVNVLVSEAAGLAERLGQISRDIGVRLSSKTFVTHKIDPQVDDARDCLAQDLLLSGSLVGLVYIGGVGAASPEERRYNYTLDLYFTDGLRVVLIVDDAYVGAGWLELPEWEWPIGTASAAPDR